MKAYHHLTTSTTSKSLNHRCRTRKCIIVNPNIALQESNPSPTKYYAGVSLLSYTQIQRNHQKHTTIRSGTKIDTLLSCSISVPRKIIIMLLHLHNSGILQKFQKLNKITNDVNKYHSPLKCSSTIIDHPSTCSEDQLLLPPPHHHH